jgi:hypothetical protein
MQEIYEMKLISSNFIKNINKNAEKVLNKYKPEITDDIFQNQLYDKGIDGTGKSLGKYKSTTIFSKNAKQQKTSNITLKDTGDFYNGGKTIIKGLEINIMSSDSKSSLLQDIWGKEILELTKDNLEDKQNIVEEILVDDFKKMFK